MKKALLFCFVCLSLASCGRRGSLEPCGQEDAPYPRQYPAPESNFAEV
ncbi:MAG: lipoprotein [Holosporaceae bacterium]|nr:lipoprotein [Holosporaceae bacterium]